MNSIEHNDKPPVPRYEFHQGGYAAISIDRWLWTSRYDDDVISTMFGQIAQHGETTIEEIRELLGRRFITTGSHSIRLRRKGRTVIVSDGVSPFLARIVGRALREMEADLVIDETDSAGVPTRFLMCLSATRLFGDKRRRISPYSLYLQGPDGKRSKMPSSNEYHDLPERSQPAPLEALGLKPSDQCGRVIEYV